MATRRWVGELETWMRRTGATKEDVAKKSKHGTAHVLEMFEAREPNPSLRLYLEILGVAGARLNGVQGNTPKDVIDRLAELRDQRDLSNADISRLAGVARPTISTLFNDPDPNPGLAMFDKIVDALEAQKEFGLVSVDDARATFRTFVGGAGSVTTEVNSGPSRPQPPLHVVAPPSVNVDDRRTEEARGAEQRAQVSYDREQAANTRQTETQQKYDDLHDENLRLTRKSLEDEFELRAFRTERRWDIAKKVGVGAACFVTGGLLTAAFMPRRK